MGIDLQLSEEQELIGTTANEFFGKYCPPELVREYETGASDFPGELWSRMAELSHRPATSAAKLAARSVWSGSAARLSRSSGSASTS